MYLALIRASILFFGLRGAQNKKCWLFCVFNMYFTARYEKCNASGQMEDIRLPIVNELLML